MQDSDEGYTKTTTHNYVSRKAKLEGAKQVELKGRSILQDHVVVRGDLAVIRIGRYCEVDQHSTLEPPTHPLNRNQHIPMILHSHSHVGSHCRIRAAAIGSHVWIGNNVILGERVIVKDNCILEDGVVVGSDTVIPPFTRVLRGAEGMACPWSELPPSIAMELQQMSLDRYQEF